MTNLLNYYFATVANIKTVIKMANIETSVLRKTMFQQNGAEVGQYQNSFPILKTLSPFFLRELEVKQNPDTYLAKRKVSGV